jgi:hypothetical protein
MLAHSPSIVMNNLVLCLDAGNSKSYPGSGTTWTDLSGNGNTGTLTNGPTYSSANGGSMVFDGSNDYVTLGSTLNATAQGTISFWIKLTNTITSGYAGNQRPWGKSGNFECRWGGNGGENDRRLSFDIGASSNPGSISSIQDTWLNTVWYNVAMTYNSSTNSSSLYIQGVLDTTGTAANPSTQVGAWNIGATSSTAGPVNGQISNFSIYNRALSAAEISQNYNALKGRFSI